MNPSQGFDFAAVLVTVANIAEGERIAEALVGERLAACVNVVGPIRSIFAWEGSIQREEEHLLIIKTRVASLDAVDARVRALHSYSTPEIIALPIVAGSRPYLDWIASSVDSAAN